MYDPDVEEHRRLAHLGQALSRAAAGEPRTSTSAVLAAVFLAVAVLWWRLVTLLVGRLSALLRHPAVRRRIDALTGSVLIGLAARVALEPR